MLRDATVRFYVIRFYLLFIGRFKFLLISVCEMRDVNAVADIECRGHRVDRVR